jgi:hypothetical protein
MPRLTRHRVGFACANAPARSAIMPLITLIVILIAVGMLLWPVGSVNREGLRALSH